VVLLAVGCGGKSAQPLTKSEYLAQMAPIEKALIVAGDAPGFDGEGKAERDAWVNYQVALRDTVTQLKEITPPAGAQKLHEQLKTAADKYADALDPLVAEINAGKDETAYGPLLGAQGALDDAEAALDAFAKADENSNARPPNVVYTV
jgi:hypothetical protein